MAMGFLKELNLFKRSYHHIHLLNGTKNLQLEKLNKLVKLFSEKTMIDTMVPRLNQNVTNRYERININTHRNVSYRTIIERKEYILT